MSETVTVLIIEDDPVDAELMVRELKRDGFVPEWSRVETEEEFLAQLDRSPDVILADSKMPLFDGFEALDLLQKRALDIPFILVSGRLGEDLAVEAMKRGACDYLLRAGWRVSEKRSAARSTIGVYAPNEPGPSARSDRARSVTGSSQKPAPITFTRSARVRTAP
jgi:DNA-binding NtrC family response regulator